MYRTLDSAKIVATLELLERRIGERFAGASLGRVCAELTQIARETDKRAHMLAQPTYWMRAVSAALVVAGAVMIGIVATAIKVKLDTETLYSTLQGIEAGLNILLVVGAAVIFLVTLEGRWKRQQALGDLDELRSIVHVIDMHQLTKDPSGSMARVDETASSPKRTLSAGELVRYLDYCSEMLSLSAKVAALYAQSSKDPQVVEAASDLQQITANLSAKIWQKITIAQADMRLTEAVARSQPAGKAGDEAALSSAAAAATVSSAASGAA